MSELSRTALYHWHLKQNAKMVGFGGYEMPIHYGSQLEEHHQVRRDAGLFDVSHMTIVDFHGEATGTFLSQLLANDIAKAQKAPGKAIYTCMLKPDGGIIDDLITYFIRPDYYRMVVNAATRAKDLAWIEAQRAALAPSVSMRHRADLSMIAVQGPEARARVMAVLEAPELAALKPFVGTFLQVAGQEYFVARTGYTGEDGFEILCANEVTADLADRLLATGVKPIGLGARDTLRLEAGLNLYGSDMDESTTPWETNLGWTVSLGERDFIGKAALLKQQQDGVPNALVGLVLDQGIPRGHYPVLDAAGQPVGEVSSGSFAPTLGQGIAMARVRADAGAELSVEIRGKAHPARIVKMPFVKQGKATF